ncbi:MAG: hypothetical protein LBU19_08340 [Treponema sp.]|jgi:hypothetical protein|nr:hypothetical protein [Treponema sp.]
MRRKQKGKPGFIVITMAVFLFTVCASPPSAQDREASQNKRRSETPAIIAQPPRPRWIQQTPDSAEFLYFTGMGEAASEPEARNAAMRNGFAAAAGFYGSLIQSEAMDRSVFAEDLGRIIADAAAYDDKTNSYTNAVVSELRAVEYYTESYRAADTRLSYRVWVLCRVSRQKAEEDRANFAKNISEQYSPLLSHRDTLSAALYSYSAILSTLEQNPLHRALAYYDAPGGRVGLYDYCGLQINAIAITFDPLPAVSVLRGRSLSCTVRLSSAAFAEIGAVPCRVAIVGKSGGIAPEEYPLEKDNSFTLRLPTAALEAGNYTVQVELLLNTLAPARRQNPRAAFSLDILPAAAEIRFEGETLSPAEERVLSQALQGALQNHKVPLLAGYEFLVTFNIRTRTEPLTGTNLLLCDLSVGLISAGTVVYQSDPKRITEISRDHALKLAADYIRGNGEFWAAVSRVISNR